MHGKFKISGIYITYDREMNQSYNTKPNPSKQYSIIAHVDIIPLKLYGSQA